MIYLRAGSYDLFLIGCLTSKSQLYVADRELFYFTFYFFLWRIDAATFAKFNKPPLC